MCYGKEIYMDIHKKILNVNKFLITGRVTFCVTQ